MSFVVSQSMAPSIMHIIYPLLTTIAQHLPIFTGPRVVLVPTSAINCPSCCNDEGFELVLQIVGA
jgi:hypothetical protein